MSVEGIDRKLRHGDQGSQSHYWVKGINNNPYVKIRGSIPTVEIRRDGSGSPKVGWFSPENTASQSKKCHFYSSQPDACSRIDLGPAACAKH
jgi:hypothetical protein